MGGRTYQVTVAQTAIQLMAKSKDRTMYQISVPGTNNVYISFDPNVTTSNGFRIPPNNVFPQDTGNQIDPHGELWAISDAGNNVVTIFESIGIPSYARGEAVR